MYGLSDQCVRRQVARSATRCLQGSQPRRCVQPWRPSPGVAPHSSTACMAALLHHRCSFLPWRCCWDRQGKLIMQQPMPPLTLRLLDTVQWRACLPACSFLLDVGCTMQSALSASFCGSRRIASMLMEKLPCCQGLPVASLQWGPWAGAGMATQGSGAAARLLRLGLQPMRPHIALAALGDTCNLALGHVVPKTLCLCRWYDAQDQPYQVCRPAER